MATTQLDAIVPALTAIVGSQGITSLADLPPHQAHRLQQAVSPNAPHQQSDQIVVTAATPSELAAVMTHIHQHGWKMLVCGNSSKLTWGSLRQGIQVIISTARLNRLVDHAVGDLTVTVEAGMKLVDLQTILAPTHQFLAVDPLYPGQATIGGIIATADTGALRQRYGGIRDMLLGISFVRSDGQLVKAGGRVVKNVAGYDLMKLMAGSYGTLGTIVQATFRLYPQPPASKTILLLGNAVNLNQVSQALMASALTPTAATLISSNLVKQLALGESMALLVRFQGLPTSIEEQTRYLQKFGQTGACASRILEGVEESALWQRLRESMEINAPTGPMTGKMGVLPIAAIATLSEVDRIGGAGFLQAASGLGWVQFPSSLSIAQLMEIRSICQAKSGFLSILQAPSVLKQQMDVWGYSGNALEIMQRLKRRFDPKNQLSPGCFINGL